MRCFLAKVLVVHRGLVIAHRMWGKLWSIPQIWLVARSRSSLHPCRTNNPRLQSKTWSRIHVHVWMLVFGRRWWVVELKLSKDFRRYSFLGTPKTLGGCLAGAELLCFFNLCMINVLTWCCCSATPHPRLMTNVAAFSRILLHLWYETLRIFTDKWSKQYVVHSR